MPLTVHKYELQPGHQAILMPADARVLSVVVQGEQGLMLYALVDTEQSLVAREFYVTGTGHDITLEGESLLGAFVGTVAIESALWPTTMYFHVFEAGA